MILFLFLVMLLPLKRHPWLNVWFGSATLPQWVGLACVIYALTYLLSRKSVPAFLRTSQARWFLILTAIMLISYFTMTGGSLGGESNPATSTLSMLMLWFTTLVVIDTEKRMRWTLFATIASAGWASTYVIRAAIKTRAWASGVKLVGWVVGDANLFGVCLALVLPLAWTMRQEGNSPWARRLCLGSAGLMLVAATLSGSRGGFLGVAAGSFVIIWRSRRRVRNLAIAGLLLAVFNLAYPASPLQRLMNPTTRDKQNAQVRLVQWKIALRLVQEHPIAGIGLGRFKVEMQRYLPDDYEDKAYLAHNAFLHIAAELGLPSVLAFVLMFVSTLRSLGRLRMTVSAPVTVRQAAAGLQAGVIGGLVAVSFVSAFEHRMLWFILFLSMALVPLADRAERAASGVSASGSSEGALSGQGDRNLPGGKRAEDG